MKNFNVELRVRFKEGILDPQAEAILNSLKKLEFKNVESLRVEKTFVLNLQSDTESHALQQGREMAQKLLANVVMENFEVNLVDA